jgi:hypothetical protein
VVPRAVSCAVGAAAITLAGAARAVDVSVPPCEVDPKTGEETCETLTIDISNTTEIGYHFDNRNVTTGDTPTTLKPEEHVDDNYGEWLNRLYLRLFYWKLSLGARVDSAVYFATLDRQDAQDLIVEQLGAPRLTLENAFAGELHSRYTSVVYPSKLWLGFKHEGFEATVGDFYEQLGRGLVFSVRKIDEVGIDTTVRGVKLTFKEDFDDFVLDLDAFGGQLNPIRIDYATGRILHGSGSPVFFGFPEVADFEYYVPSFRPGERETYDPIIERAKPSYLEDNVVGGGFQIGPPAIHFGANTAFLFRQANSEAQQRCIAALPDGIANEADQLDFCRAENPDFGVPEASRAHDQIRNFSGTITVPPIDGVADFFVEVAGQQQTDGRVSSIGPDGSAAREDDLWGYAVYANANIRGGIFAATIEAKHYHAFFPLGANIDFNASDRAFGAREYNVITYSRPPTAESIYIETLGARDNCVSGGRGRLDANIAPQLNVYGWLGYFVSWAEIDTNNNQCNYEAPLQTNTIDTAGGAEINTSDGESHYWAWVGGRFTEREEPIVLPSGGTSGVFYREGYVRYDFTQHLAGDFSLSLLGNARRRYEPDQLVESWWEGENLLALNYNPHLSFIAGYEFQTRPGEGLPTHYFNGAIQFRSKSPDTWWGQIFDSARLFVGQRRSALRCVGGVCRVFPAFEGMKLEIVSRF